jgi:hypothetical protein
MDKYCIRKANFKKTDKFAIAQAKYRSSDKGKISKASRAKRFNASPKGKLVKQRADASYRSTDAGKMRIKISERLRKMGNAGRKTSSKVFQWLGFEDSESVQKWINTQLSPGEVFSEHQIDHVIPFLVFQWERIGDVIVRKNELDEEEMKKVWSVDNLQLMKGFANQQKRERLPSDEELLKRSHLWPSWWGDVLPDHRLRSKLDGARGKRVLG